MRDAEEYVASGRGDQFKAVHATHISQTHSHTQDSSQYCDDLLSVCAAWCPVWHRHLTVFMTRSRASLYGVKRTTLDLERGGHRLSDR